jgi:hypothetical protein
MAIAICALLASLQAAPAFGAERVVLFEKFTNTS